MIRLFVYLIILNCNYVSSFAQVKSESITITNEGIQLPGTLSYGKENSPLVIWVHGSGNIDRNGNQKPMVKANYIKQFRDEINKKEIAFFSYDKRTATPSNLKLMKSDTTKNIVVQNFVNDIKQVVNYFKDDKRFSEIILIGHSQGSLIAMLALENVDKYISLAGAGETIDKIMVKQVSKQNTEFGKITAQYFKELKETGKIKEVNPFLLSLFAKPNQPFLASWIKLNPVEEIKKVTIPTLIINGDKDIQVAIENAKSLKAAKPDAQLVIIKNMNHVLKNIQKDEDNLKSYRTSNFNISKQLIETVSHFINNTQ